MGISRENPFMQNLLTFWCIEIKIDTVTVINLDCKLPTVCTLLSITGPSNCNDHQKIGHAHTLNGTDICSYNMVGHIGILQWSPDMQTLEIGLKRARTFLSWHRYVFGQRKWELFSVPHSTGGNHLSTAGLMWINVIPVCICVCLHFRIFVFVYLCICVSVFFVMCTCALWD